MRRPDAGVAMKGRHVDVYEARLICFEAKSKMHCPPLPVCFLIITAFLFCAPCAVEAAPQKSSWSSQLQHITMIISDTFLRYEEATRWGFTSLLNQVSSLPLQPSNPIPAWINGKEPSKSFRIFLPLLFVGICCVL